MPGPNPEDQDQMSPADAAMTPAEEAPDPDRKLLAPLRSPSFAGSSWPASELLCRNVWSRHLLAITRELLLLLHHQTDASSLTRHKNKGLQSLSGEILIFLKLCEWNGAEMFSFCHLSGGASGVEPHSAHSLTFPFRVKPCENNNQPITLGTYWLVHPMEECGLPAQ